MNYNFKKIEKKWRDWWKSNKTYSVTEDLTKKKFYVLDMFPYPSGSGLHVGHPLGYIASDIYARYKRLNGFNVLHPMGYDSFGLPAEQYAIQTGQHPNITTENNIKRYREQLDKIGFSFDWDREIRTSDPKYYKWTQWIFKQLFNSYYCSINDKACHISELIKEFEINGNKKVQSPCDGDTQLFDSKEWVNFNEKKQQEILLKYRLAYLSDTWVNWCPALGTVLANDEVKDGYSERGNFPVEQKKMRQWSLRITAYANRLLNGLNNIDWNSSIKEMQRNWIGKSKGALIKFKVAKNVNSVEVFTTRPDTIFGVSFMVIAPEHPIVHKITTKKQYQNVLDYCNDVSLKSERDRQSNNKNITGVFSGSYAIHPLTKKTIPIWIADYVIASYGSGAIMAVPCGDQRDWNFAKKFNLDIPNIFKNTDVSESANESLECTIINSDFLNNLNSRDAIKKSISTIEKLNIGTIKTNFRIRDAVFSRQRYWGEPFPVYYKDDTPYILNNNSCLQLPKINKYLPTKEGNPPLARAKKEDWNIFDGEKMEYNTMPGWAGSSWYFLRFMDPNNNYEFVAEEKVNYWGQVDLYMGGAEHAVGHLLYSRFWTHFLFDLGYLKFQEPFKKLINQGMILGRSNFVYRKTDTSEFVTYEKRHNYKTTKIHVDIGLVNNDILDVEKFTQWRPEFSNAKFILNDSGNYLCGFEIEKMSKSKYNTQSPDELIEKYGADTLRMYEMFLGPIEQYKPWDIKGINGVHNFLKKLWRLTHNEKNKLIVTDVNPTKEEYKSIHICIKKITQDLERFSFNTIVSHLMICLNELINQDCNKRKIITDYIILLSPYAPFICEEIWSSLGHSSSINDAKWPKFEEKYIKEDSINYPIAFNGKMRFTLNLNCKLSKKEIEEIIIKNPKTINYLNNNQLKKIIIVPNKIINIVF
ncbi:MAG: leucine--tRNA ligase [Flavobacteriales bacterium]|nr:leucine--tRNA ligase [Flavobacteriales bacterium]